LASILSAPNSTKKSIRLVLILTSSYFVIQIVAGVNIGSLAIISDAGHMLIDVGGLVMALLAISFTQKPATPTRTYGFYRGEILASLLNSIFLILLSIFILTEGFQRIIHPAQVSGLPMIVIASVGLAINLVGVRILGKLRRNRNRSEQSHTIEGDTKIKAKVTEENLNVHSAYLEVFADTIGSAGVIVAGIIVYFSGFYPADPLISFGIVALIIPRTWLLLKKAIHILIEGTPIHLCHEEIKNSILNVKGVSGVFDLHIWTISSGIHALSAHVVTMDNKRSSAILQEINSILEKGYDITHATIQIESYHESGNI
jgi:cobalt-zinc-cadmium efflux system protein